MGSAFECSICLSPYDFQEHMPVVLPTCGHTFCLTCVSQLSSPKHCPTDRRQITTPVDQIPKNYALLAAASYATNLEAATYLQDLGRKAAAQVHISPDLLHFPPATQPVWDSLIVASFNGVEVALVHLPSTEHASPDRGTITAAAGLVCSSKFFRHTTKLFGITQLDQGFFLVHQLLRQSLSTRLASMVQGGIDQRLQPTLHVGIVVAKALVQLHAVGFSHGQINANSVVMDDFEDPLLDLRRMSPQGLSSSAAALLHPAAAASSYTFQRSSSLPRSCTAAAKNDVSQLATLLLHMLTGVPPPHTRNHPPFPSGLPPALATLLHDCHGDPASCPAAPQVLQGLQSVLYELTGSSTPTAHLAARRNPAFGPAPTASLDLPRPSLAPLPPTPTTPLEMVSTADPLCLLTFISSGDHHTPQLAATRLTRLLATPSSPPPADLPILLPPLVHLLGHRTNPWAAHTAATLLLATLATHPSSKPALIDSGALPRLLSHLPTHSTPPTPTTPHAAAILARLSDSTPTVRLLLTEAGCIPHLLPLINPTLHPPETLSSAATTFRHISTLPEGCDALLAFNAIPPLIALLSGLTCPHPAAAQAAVATLDNLAASDQAKILIAEAGALRMLPPALYPAAPAAVLDPATHLVFQLAQLQCNRQGLVEGGVVVLLKPLLLHNIPAVKRSALAAVEKLAQENRTAQVELTESGCLKPLVQLLRTSGLPLDALLPAIWATAHLTCAYEKAALVLSARNSPAPRSLTLLLAHPDEAVVRGVLGVMRGMAGCSRGRKALRRVGAAAALGPVVDRGDGEVRGVAEDLRRQLGPTGCLFGG